MAANMADSTKPGKAHSKRATRDENGSIADSLVGSSTSTASAYDPATLLCELLFLFTRI